MQNITTVNIDSFPVLKKLLRRPKTNPHQHLMVTVCIPGLTEKQHQELENKTNRYLNTCGCRQGMVLGILLIATRCLYFSAGSWIVRNVYFDLVILLFLGMITGKLGTIVFYRVSLGITIYRMTNSLHPSFI